MGTFGNHPPPHPNPYKINCKYIDPVEVEPFLVGVYSETTCVSARVCACVRACVCVRLQRNAGAYMFARRLQEQYMPGLSCSWCWNSEPTGKPQSRQLSGVPRTSQPRASSEETLLRKRQGILKRIPWHFVGRGVDNSEMTHS